MDHRMWMLQSYALINALARTRQENIMIEWREVRQKKKYSARGKQKWQLQYSDANLSGANRYCNKNSANQSESPSDQVGCI